MSEPKRLSVFYSWQSDLPDSSNRSLIRQALRAAASSVERQEENLIVDIDEATRSVSGSPNIPTTILAKIASADAFVCDITTINSDQSGKKTPNPNVVFELGYAIANVGWQRTILLFNDAFGKFPADLPFDFDRHRATKYSSPNPSSKKHLNDLAAVLATALGSIVKNDPEKPNSVETPEQRKRNHDVSNINWVMSSLHLPTLDQHVQECPHMLSDRVLYFWEGFNGVMSNSLFHLYDQNLLNLFRHYHESFHETVRHAEEYHPNHDNSAYIFTNTGDLPLPARREAVWNLIRNAAQEMQKTMPKILSTIRDDYLEVSVDENNKAAWRDYVQFKKEQAQALEDDQSH
ncbi:TIR domain-containing protein [Herbaspirillum sp. C9C3]|uniref:TIR domain-containing protein n=1 Tax=Herbaspirillum sp. C9C3 TaxID=2735271 RepID=UPI00158509A5|nr:TIR domain-containing protein [Herbaspirillum sp. C9C3]NUT60150.1 hypothetical protein [Herbaspirillum sp. C9C3]